MGSSAAPPISLAPKQNANRNMSDTNAMLAITGTSDAPPNDDTYTALVVTPVEASQ